MKPRNSRFKCHGAAILVVAASLPALAQAYSAGQWGSGEKIYAKVCSLCHDTSVAPSLFGRNLSGAYIREVVLGGRGPMPAFRPTDFNDQELESLSLFLQTQKEGRRRGQADLSAASGGPR